MLSADLFAACPEATFDQCISCTNADSDGKHVCNACGYGYTLKDDKSACLCKYKPAQYCVIHLSDKVDMLNKKSHKPCINRTIDHVYL